MLLVVLRRLRPVNMQQEFQQTVQMTVVEPIDRVGHCSYDTVTGILLVQTAEDRCDSSCAVLWQGC